MIIMINVIKGLFQKYNLPIPILYIMIIIFYFNLYKSPNNDYIVESIISKVFNSNEMLKFVDSFIANIITIFWILNAFLTGKLILNFDLYWKIISDRFLSLTFFLSAFKLFTYILINYEKSPEENFDIISRPLIKVIIIYAVICIVASVINRKINKI